MFVECSVSVSSAFKRRRGRVDENGEVDIKGKSNHKSLPGNDCGECIIIQQWYILCYLLKNNRLLAQQSWMYKTLTLFISIGSIL